MVEESIDGERLFRPGGARALIESVGMRLTLDNLQGQQRVCVDEPAKRLATSNDVHRHVHAAFDTEHFNSADSVSLVGVGVVR
jgi:hypothetical protein